MGNNVTNTQDGAKKRYCLTEKEVEKYMKKTEGCAVIFKPQIEVAPEGFDRTAKNVTCQEVASAPTIESGILPEEQGPSLNTVGAAQIADEVTVVVDSSGRVSEARTAKEDGSRKAAREAREVRESAEEKYYRNRDPEGRNTTEDTEQDPNSGR